MTKPKVFVSYSHSDKAWAQKFAETLGKLGMGVWLNQLDPQIEQDWAESVENRLEESDVVVFLIQPENINNPYLLFELGAALSTKKSVVPVVPQNFETRKLPLLPRSVEWVSRTSPEETALEFSRSLETLSEKAA